MADSAVTILDSVIGRQLVVALIDGIDAVSRFPARFSYVGAPPGADSPLSPAQTLPPPGPADYETTIRDSVLNLNVPTSQMDAIFAVAFFPNRFSYFSGLEPPFPRVTPLNTILPAISGTVQVGQTLSATNGTWTNNPTSFTYQWNRSGAPIGGATASTYVPVSADVGSTLTVTVVATNGFGPSSAASAATSAVIDVIPTINTAASIPGTPQVGVAITAIDAIWNNSVTSRAYQWKVAGVNGAGSGATTLSYTPTGGDFGKTLTVTVTATNSGGTSAPSTSAASAAVIAGGGDALNIGLNLTVDSVPIGA
jgi:hypothetical protein